MKIRKVASLCIAAVYVVCTTITPVVADNEFEGGAHGNSDGAWGWNPPNHDRFGSNDGAGGGGFFDGADDYGSGNGGRFGGGGPFGGGGGQFTGRMGLFAVLISLIAGQTGLVGQQRDRAGAATANLMMADAGKQGNRSVGTRSSKLPGRFQAPGGVVFKAP